MQKSSKALLMLFIAVCFSVVMVVQAYAATEAQKQAAIDAGLAYLASTQNPDGSWTYPYSNIASTAAALLAFTEQKYKPLGWNGPNYSAAVTNATNYILNNASSVDISSGAFWGNSSNDGSNLGIQWEGAGENTYITGLVLPALARLTAGIVTPGTTIVSANPVVNGLTYQQVIQRTVDMFEWGQNGPAAGVKDGGWRYLPKTGDSDNSTAQWPAMGMLFAEQVPGITVAPQTKAELQNWINYIQNPVSGGSGYDSPFSLVDESKTGGLLLEMVFAGGGGDMAKALSYLNTNWLNTANSTWYGNFGHPYAMWSIYKGLETTIGLDDMTTITNLHTDPGDIDNLNHGWNWWEDYDNWLVLNQAGDGSWPGYEYWGYYGSYPSLSTAWDINILNATAIGPPQPPSTIPEPSSIVLLGAGLFGLGLFGRRKLRK